MPHRWQARRPTQRGTPADPPAGSAAEGRRRPGCTIVPRHLGSRPGAPGAPASAYPLRWAVRQRAADAGPGARGGGAPGGRHILRYGHAPAKPGEAARRARRDRTASPAPARASHGIPARLLAAGQVVASDPASPPITGSAAARCPATGLNSPADRTPQPRPRQGQSVLGRRAGPDRPAPGRPGRRRRTHPADSRMARGRLTPRTGRRPGRRDPARPYRRRPARLYLPRRPAADALLQRLVHTDGQVVSARKPYWGTLGVTIADPDGYRLVLSHRTWQ